MGLPETLTRFSLAFFIITYIIAAFKTAQCIVGNDAEKEFVCFLLAIPIFVGYYALFVLACHGIKTVLYAYFKSHRKEWNSIADREEMEEYIALNLGHIQKKAQEKTATITNTKNAAPIADDTPKRERNVESHSPEEITVTPEALEKLQLKRDIQKAHDELEVRRQLLSLRSICFMPGLATPNLQAYKRRCTTLRAHIQSKSTRTS